MDNAACVAFALRLILQGKLSDKCIECFLLASVYGLKHEEVAERLNTSKEKACIMHRNTLFRVIREGRSWARKENNHNGSNA
jgi:DNA-directed RNA polymerase specialized sigma24 family protein